MKVVNSTLPNDARDAIVKTIAQMKTVAPLPAAFYRKSIQMRVTFLVGSASLKTLHTPAK